MERWQLAQRQSLPLEAKVVLSRRRIREWHDYWRGDIYVAFSGGKDSTVLLHLVRSLYPKVPAVFLDTGLEYPEVKEFVRATDDVTWLKPKMSFVQVIERYGYPVVSKLQSQYIYECRNTNSEKLRDIRLNGRYGGIGKIAEKWKFLLDAPFKISEWCCDVLKKNQASRYEKDTGLRPLLGASAGESYYRRREYLRFGCNAFTASRPISRPMAFWTEGDTWGYLREYGVPYSEIYDLGWDRTGCMFCMFGVHMEEPPNRFQRMKSTHPKLHAYCMGKLGLREVLEYMGIPSE